jgi:hypothetical protein
VVTLVSTFTGVWTPSLAGPDVSWSSDDVDYAQDVCMQRAKAAFAWKDWVSTHTSGQPGLATVAHKEPLVAVILWVDRVIDADHSVPSFSCPAATAIWGQLNGTGCRLR